MISLMALPPIGAVHETPASHLGRSPRICSCRGRSADTEIMKQLFAFFVFVFAFVFVFVFTIDVSREKF